jgi:hypothetical protein
MSWRLEQENEKLKETNSYLRNKLKSINKEIGVVKRNLKKLQKKALSYAASLLETNGDITDEVFESKMNKKKKKNEPK